MNRQVVEEKELNNFWAFALNDCFIDYVKELVKTHTNNPDYNILDGQDDDFIIPGRLELVLDGYKAYLELSSDVLAAIYQIILIKNDTMNNRFLGGENVDLREYK